MNIYTDTKAAREHTKALLSLKRSAFPSAIRNTLNDAAFDMKRKTIQQSTQKNFKVRNKTFFKKYSGVEKAQGFNVSNMRSLVGYNASDSKVRTAIENLQKQETGGVIDDGRRYLKASRGGNLGRLVQRRNYYDKSKVVTGQNRGRGGTRKSKFVARMFRAQKENKPMFLNTMKGNYLAVVKSGGRRKGGIKFRLEFLTMDRSIKSSKIKATHFNKEAAEITRRKMNDFYVNNAEFQIKKAMK